MSIKTLSPLYPSSGGSPGYEMYTVHNNGNMDTYMMQGTELNPRQPSPVFENFETMTNDTTSAYIVDPSLYYPTANSYGYYCTGYESPGEWDEQHAVYGVDGTDGQYMAQGAQIENMPYLYYTPNYGYGESPFNPYNPYIPGAMVGVDGSCVGTQPYYVSPYSDNVSSPGYYPVLVQSGGNVLPSSSTGVISDVGPSTIHRANASSTKRTHLSTSAPYSVNKTKATSSQTSLLKGASQISKVDAGNAKRPMSSYNIGSGGSASSHMSQSGSTRSSLQPVGTHLPELNQTKYSYPAGSTLMNIMATANGQTITNENLSKLYNRRAFNDSNSNVDPLSEKNRGPRSSKSRNQITVKAYTTKAGNCNSEGNIVISADEYNKDDFPVDYPNAKFFVIKSYSEDDVHKSVKYNVWSSTPNGNRKLNIAYEDAQKIAAGKSRGCPIFLFFSVNASGQFCGVAEMVGPVEFDRDMDFWQQDKWSGSFPVKWHMIKDVSNPTFRHIILENNEHKPVTNSRDTQEILYKPGLEMLKVFKNYTSKTSLLDDFIYYENRQRMMCEERSRFLRRANGHVHAHEQPTQLNHVTDRPPKDGVGSWVEKVRATEKTAGATSEKMHSFTVPTEKSCAASNKQTPSEVEPSSLTGHTDKSCAANNNQVPSETGPTSITGQADKSCAASNKQIPLEVRPAGDVSTVKMGSLSIYPTVGTPGNNVVTVGSLPIKVDGRIHKPPGTLTIGTIALDPETLQTSKKGFLKAGLEK